MGELKRLKTIDWEITRNCNYNCSYCFLLDKKIVGQIEVGNYDKIVSWLKGLKDSYEVIITGGEPFIVSNLENIINDLVSKTNHKFALITNLSAPTDKIINILQIARGRIAWMVASLHLEQIKIKDFIAKARQIDDFLHSTGSYLVVAAVARRKILRKLDKIGQILDRKKIKFKLQPKKEKGKFIKYSKEEEKIIKKYKRDFGLGDVNFKGRVCYTGMDYFVINGAGDVWRCYSARKNSKADSGYLGNILMGNLKRWRYPRKCIYDNCNCINFKRSNMIV